MIKRYHTPVYSRTEFDAMVAALRVNDRDALARLGAAFMLKFGATVYHELRRAALQEIAQ